ncbi:protein-glutamate methylesterase/protein-glutamine glutaminase [Catenovulum maritimum]|uniref:Protein-glutamate methylesterase/protein-glutamine glutaminase n=1 Tax=Catenovulum maritimum TaxID=1513271 RepID=A0A0J8GXQ2_9ALTE|nr:chemotaxis response regulator protein-glutamate methylesterase [Catenovulum maritimum]KMT65503.1 chemotaxis protein CheY [Catenovulum maritimum]
MPINVLVVDDSSFFRRRVSEIIEKDPELTVIGTANDGKDAIEKAVKLKPDVITMDVEMPVMDGITSVKEIMKVCPTPILMFSSLTHDGAKATLDALDAGALDFLPKKFEDIARNREDAVGLLLSRIKQIAKRRVFRSRASLASSPSLRPAARKPLVGTKTEQKPSVSTSNFRAKRKSTFKLLAIGTSTGGPVALQNILTQLPSNYPYPIILVQHMPAAFTPAFASRLNSMCQIKVKEAESGDVLMPGCAYLAPGGKQMLVDGSSSTAKLLIKEDNSERLTYKPSVDVTFATAAKIYRDSVLGIILTGMGADGREGCRLLKSAGSEIWAQDEASCVVYGMPQAVFSAGIATESIPLNEIANKIISVS